MSALISIQNISSAEGAWLSPESGAVVRLDMTADRRPPMGYGGSVSLHLHTADQALLVLEAVGVALALLQENGDSPA